MGLARTGLFVRRSVGGLFAVEDMAVSTGARIFVHSGTGTDAGGYGTGPDKPVATLDYAVGLCTASKSDIIFVMPGHVETLTAATGVNMDVAGVRVVGLGQGNLRPTFTLGAAAASITVSGGNCSIENIRVVGNFLNIVTAFTIAATADGLTLKNIDYYDTSVILGSLIGISVAAGVTDMSVIGCNYYGIALTAAATNFMLCAGAVDRLTVKDCYIKGDFSDGIIVATAAKSIDTLFKDLLIINMSETGKGINLKADTTGAADNVMAYLEDETGNEKAITGAAMFMTDRVKQTNVVTASPFLCIAADS